MASIKQIQLNGVDYNLVDTDTLTALNNHIGNAVKYNYYGVCSTSASEKAKTVTVDSSFKLVAGVSVTIKFTNSNSVSSPTLNVNGTGAKALRRYGTTAISTATTTSGWTAGAVQTFTYDGTAWYRDYWSNTTYSNVSLGQGYGVCSTAAATAAKTAKITSYALIDGGIVVIKFNNAVPANATLNIIYNDEGASHGAKSIKYRGAAITAGIINAGDTASFIYEADDTSYHLISVDKIGITEDDIVDALGYLPAEMNTQYQMQEQDGLLKLVETNGVSTFATDTETETPITIDHYSSILAVDSDGRLKGFRPIIYIDDIDPNFRLPISKGGTNAITAEEALQNFGLIATTTELNYCDGVTSNIQNQLNDLNTSKVKYVDELIINCGTSTVNVFN